VVADRRAAGVIAFPRGDEGHARQPAEREVCSQAAQVSSRARHTDVTTSYATLPSSSRILGGVLLNEFPRVHATIADLIRRVSDGELKVTIDRMIPLAEAAAGHAYVESRQAFGRVVMTP
jgi:NADPH:quinone reductase-like Zn-dependent oxidoreductase